MTTALEPRPTALPANLDKLLRRTWFWDGVRRGDRRALLSEVRGELEAALEAGLTSDAVLGPQPAVTATQWARERELTDRRLRLGVVLPAVVVGALLGAGGTLSLLTVAFATGQDDLPGVDGVALLALYVGSGLLAATTAVALCLASLTLIGDSTARRTVRALLVTLPLGAALTVPAAMGTALALHFRTQPRTFLAVGVVVFLGFLAISASARVLAVRSRSHPG